MSDSTEQFNGDLDNGKETIPSQGGWGWFVEATEEEQCDSEEEKTDCDDEDSKYRDHQAGVTNSSMYQYGLNKSSSNFQYHSSVSSVSFVSSKNNSSHLIDSSLEKRKCTIDSVPETEVYVFDKKDTQDQVSNQRPSELAWLVGKLILSVALIACIKKLKLA